MALDVLFENARIIDGTGAPWFAGAIGIEDGRIAEVERRSEHGLDAEQVVDVENATVAPGFIDTHSHSDLELFASPSLAPKTRQGITTEILGQDGFSMAPMYPDDGAETWRQHLGALAGEVEKDWTWGSLTDYFDAIATSGIGPNVASLVGHGTVRFNVVGMDSREPTGSEMDEMVDLVEESLDHGAIGFSTGLIYPPCSYGETNELHRLAGPLAEYGRPFVAHIRSEGRWIWAALDEFIDVGAAEDIPLHISHFKVAGTAQHGKASRAIAMVETARDRGVDVTVEQYPYTAGSTMLSAVLPPWVHAEGPDQTLAYLEDESSRERMKRDMREWRIEGWENIGTLAGWNNVVISNTSTTANEDLEGQSVAEVATGRGVEPLDALFDILAEEELGVSCVLHLLDEEDVREIMSYERVNIATDGLFGGKPHPRVYGTYPRVLGNYVREANLLSVEEAVRKMTALPARAMGLNTKGVLRRGMDADIVVFDPEIVASQATYEDPKQYPVGISEVMVNGELVVEDSQLTGATPGQVIRP